MEINKFSPKQKLVAKHLLSADNLTETDIYEVLYLARKIKMSAKVKEKYLPLSEKTVAFMISSANSRMRVPFELAVTQLGGNTLYLSPNDMEFKSGLTYNDAIVVLKRYGVLGIVIKENSRDILSELYEKSPLPLINVWDTANNPCQLLANIFTMWEKLGKLNGLTLAYLGNCREFHSDTLKGYSKCGISIALCSPTELSLEKAQLDEASQFGDITVSDNISLSIKNADFVSSRFASIKPLTETETEKLSSYRVDEGVMSLAKDNAYFMHTLPVIHNGEVTDDVFYSARSLVFDQAENLIYIQKALMLLLFK